MTAQDTNLKALRLALRVAGKEFADRVDDLLPAAAELVQIEGAMRVAAAQCGHPSVGSSARELAAEILLGRLACLRPYVPFCTTQSADRAQEALCTKPAKTNREKAMP